MIAPPTFFGATPSSTIRQRGPPSQASGSSSSVNGPRPPILRGAAPASNNYNNNNGGRPTNGPVVAKPCIVLANVPDTATDGELAQFLRIHASRINEGEVVFKKHVL